MKINELPLFPNFVPIDLHQKELFEQYFKLYSQDISELNFTELFMWKDSFKTYICQLNGNICILIEKDNDQYFYKPVGDKEILKTIKELLYWQKKQGREGKIFGFIESLDNLNSEFMLEDVEIYSDYIYLVEDLINLKGKKYDGKRNHIKNFKKNYSYEFIPITKEIVSKCMEFQKKWCELHGCIKYSSLSEEDLAMKELFNNYEKLNVFGAVIKINSQIEAFSVGGELNSETAVIHAEKANPDFKGIYQMINNLFCEKMLAKYKYVNREQDLGDAGLKKAKMSYHPHHILNKKMLKLNI
jgi:uncharacterized protein